MIGTAVRIQPPTIPSSSSKDYHQQHLDTHESNLLLSSKENDCLSLLKRCYALKELRQVHAHFLKLGLMSDPFFAGSLLSAICTVPEWGSMPYALSVFRWVTDPGTFKFNVMIRGYVRDESYVDALLLYMEMVDAGVEPDNFTYPPLLKACAHSNELEGGTQIHAHAFKMGLRDDLYVQNSLINFYGKCRGMERAADVFEQMEKRSVSSWSATMAASISSGMWEDCLSYFARMVQEGDCRPEESIFVSVLSACARLGDLHFGRCAHASLLRNVTDLNVIVSTALIDMYTKCGSLEKGMRVFEYMEEKNHLSYGAVISGLALHGRGREALTMLSRMLERGLIPDEAAYVGVLSACSQAGLVDEGSRCFERMKAESGIEPTIRHFGCMVDLLGRAGQVGKAYEIVNSMHMKPNDVIWRSLLSACKVHGETKIGEIAACHLFNSNLQNPGDYALLSSLYSQAGRWDDVARIRLEMVSKGICQSPGSSSVEVNRTICRFISRDVRQTDCDEVSEMIHQMEWQLKFEGYVPDTSPVSLNVDEEEKRERLKGHSQKLAIAFALIHTSDGSPIRITRNLRMCSDCHTYTKYISLLYEREIIVRDRTRFHHFRNGSCSCRDYW